MLTRSPLHPYTPLLGGRCALDSFANTDKAGEPGVHIITLGRASLLRKKLHAFNNLGGPI